MYICEQNKREILLDKNSVIFFLLCLVCVRPESLLQISILGKIYTIGLYLSLVYVVIKLSHGKMYCNFAIIAMSAIYVWLFISTLLGEGNIISFVESVGLPLVAFLIVYYGMITDGEKFLKTLLFLLSLYTILHIASMIVFPHGMDWGQISFANGEEELKFFFGQKNVVIKFTLLTEFCMFLYASVYKDKIGVIEKMVAVAVFFIGLYTHSSVSVLTSIFPLVFVFIGFGRLPNIVNSLSGIIVNFLFFITIILLEKQKMFAFFIEDILGKTLTFSSRSRLWEKGLELFGEKPLLGYGVEDKLIATQRSGYSNDSFHNFIVDYLYQGGVIVIILWVIFFVALYYQIKKIKNKKVRSIGHLFAFSYMIICISEPFTRTRVTTYVIFVAIITLINKSNVIEKDTNRG